MRIRTRFLAIAGATAIAVAGCGSGPVSTGARPVMQGEGYRLLAPNGGEVFPGGDSITIAADVMPPIEGDSLYTVFSYSVDSGAHWYPIRDDDQARVTLGRGIHSVKFLPPDSVQVRDYDPAAGGEVVKMLSTRSGECLVKVYQYDFESTMFDVSDQPFRIAH